MSFKKRLFVGKSILTLITTGVIYKITGSIGKTIQGRSIFLPPKY